MKRIFICLFLIIFGVLLCSTIFGESFAFSYDIGSGVLFYKDDLDELTLDIEAYLTDVDDFIIPNSSFLYADKLKNNYDFLINFAIDYVINNRDYYYDDIAKFDSCFYNDINGLQRDTFEYVKLDAIYEITDFYFGVSDFIILNDTVCVKDNYISLSDYTNDTFSLEIEDVSVEVDELNVNALVIYDDETKFLYSFYNDKSILKLVNVGVV